MKLLKKTNQWSFSVDYLFSEITFFPVVRPAELKRSFWNLILAILRGRKGKDNIDLVCVGLTREKTFRAQNTLILDVSKRASTWDSQKSIPSPHDSSRVPKKPDRALFNDDGEMFDWSPEILGENKNAFSSLPFEILTKSHTGRRNFYAIHTA